jgi:hypothetical protein
MRLSFAPVIGFIALACFCQSALAQETPGKEYQSIPPRATPMDYQAHAKAGSVSIGAEYTGHSVAVPDALLSTEDYIVVEVGLFGAPGAHLTLSHEDFSIRINGKKPAQAQPFAAVFQSLKDPNWVPPGGSPNKSKSGGLSAGNGNADGEPPPSPPKVPVELKRIMAQRVQKAALSEGDRALPEAGLIFFQHGGKVQGIHSLELIYEGPAGKATMELQP